MYIYKDKLVEDYEVLSDGCPMVLKDDYYYESDVVFQQAQKLNIDTGANKSAEEVDDDTPEDEMIGGVALQEENLVVTGFGTKKELQVYMKGYLKKLMKLIKEEKGEEYCKEFTQKSEQFVKMICSNFKDWEFFLSGEMDEERTPMVIFKNYRDDTGKAYYLYIKDGIIAEKV